MKKILLLSLFLTSCTTFSDLYTPVYNLYVCNEKPYDKSLHYGEWACVRVDSFKTMEECESKLKNYTDYDKALCKKAYTLK